MSKTATIVGVGRLGICFGLTLERAGYNVLGVDLFPNYVKQINDKSLKSSEKNVEEYLDLRRKQERRARLNKDDILLNMYDLFLKTKESSQSNNEIVITI